MYGVALWALLLVLFVTAVVLIFLVPPRSRRRGERPRSPRRH
ncbi:hypothetical protein [Tsukamurella hominis]